MQNNSTYYANIFKRRQTKLFEVNEKTQQMKAKSNSGSTPKYQEKESLES
jgi:hypothetical protein